MKNAPVCITGGSGFVGSNLVRQLLAKHVGPITVIDHNTPAKDIAKKVRFFKGEFSDPKILSKALSHGGILIHLAGTSNQATSEKDPLRDARTSIIGTLELLETAAKMKIAKVIFLSSAPAVYGTAAKLPVETDATTFPRSAYGIMKLAVEHYVRHYADRYGFSYMILRSANAYGPGQFAATHGVVSRFAYNIISGKPVEIWGSADITRDFLYIDDLSRAIVASLKPGIKNKTLNVASGRGLTLGALVKAIEKASGRKAEKVFKERRLIDVPDLYFSIRDTKKYLAWKPQTMLDEGVAKTVAWIRDADL